MNAPYIVTRQPLSRRTFLKGGGVALALPLLDTMGRGIARAQSPAASGTAAGPRRLLAINNNLGVLKWQFFPTGAGRDYVPSKYLEAMQEHRNDFTVFSGVSYPGVDGGHHADVCFMSAAPHPGSGSFRNTISLDQFIAERIGTQTRFPSLTLAVNTRSRSLSYTGSGVAVPPEDKASVVFKQLFVQGTPAEIEQTVQNLGTGRSILDFVGEQAKALERDLGARDKERVDQYFTSVRDLESRLQMSQGWERKPKPTVKAEVPVDPETPAQYLAKVEQMYDMAKLALQTDSTRVITLMIDSVATPVVEDLPNTTISEGYHNLSHHGKSDDKMAQLLALDMAHMKLLAKLCTDLKAIKEADEAMLDRTMVYYGSSLGDANQHTCFNLPVILAGGGFKHGQHLEFSTDFTSNYPLTNIFLSMLHRMEIEVDRFASSTGTMRGLETT